MLGRVRRLWLRIQLHLAVSVMTVFITLNSLFRKVRMSHENGVTARGTVRIVDHPTFPDNAFFRPGREFPCRLRHATVLFKDDAKMTVRGASIKFADTRFESPFDMLMNTGRVGLFWDARTFMQFAKTTTQGKGKFFVSYLNKQPQALVGGGESSRRNPSSFTALSYHSQTCFEYSDTSGKRYYARYRLIAPDWPGHDSGALEKWWADHNWLQNPYPDETRTRNYLKNELRERLAEGTVEYLLQVQVRRRPPGPDPFWVTAEYDWDEEVTPFHDLAHVTLTEALDYEEAMLTWFDLENCPRPALGVPLGTSIDDPHSLNNLRKAAKWAARARLLSYKLRGMPPQFPDTRHSADWEAIPPMPDPP